MMEMSDTPTVMALQADGGSFQYRFKPPQRAITTVTEDDAR